MWRGNIQNNIKGLPFRSEQRIAMRKAILFLQKKINIPEKTLVDILKKIFPIWNLYFCFFVVTGFIMWGIIGVLVGAWFSTPLWIIFSIYGISWMIGFVTPGAPAGVGVRETALIFILSSYIGEVASISTAIILRAITVLGDIVFYLVALFISSNFIKNIKSVEKL